MDPKLLYALAVLESADGAFYEDPASDPSRWTSLVRALPVLGYPSSSPCVVWGHGSSEELLSFPKHLHHPPASPRTGL